MSIKNVVQLLAAFLLIGIQTAAAAETSGLPDSFSEPYRSIDVAASEAGIVEDILVKLGDMVEENQLLATLDHEVIAASLEVAKARAESDSAIDGANAGLKLEARRLEKLTSLHAEGHASVEEIERTKANFEIAQSRVLAAQEEKRLNKLDVQRIEAQLQRRNIVSSIRGQIVKLYREPGEYVSANEPNFVRIVQIDLLKVKMNLATEYARKLSIDDEMLVRFVQTEQVATARIEFVSPITDADSGTVRVELVIDNKERKFPSGARVRLENSPHHISHRARSINR